MKTELNALEKLSIRIVLIMIVTISVCSLISFFIGRHTVRTAGRIVYVQAPGCKDTLSEWSALQLAIVMTESDFNPLAVGTANDLGIMQLTPIYVAEVNRLCDTTRYIHADAFDITKSLQMFSIVQSGRNPQRDIIKAIQLHNPKGDTIGYSKRVLQKMDWVRRYENVRNKVVER